VGSVDFSRDAGLTDKTKSMSAAEWGDLIQVETWNKFRVWFFGVYEGQ